MIRRRFAYHRPDSVPAALALLAAHGSDARVLAGGTWVVPELTNGIAEPGVIVDVSGAGLGTVRAEDVSLRLGPAVTYADLGTSEVVARHAHLLRTLAQGITGGQQIRNQGTIGGSACYANPSSDVPAALVALDAHLRIASARGERDVDAATFFSGAFQTALADDELLTEIIVPSRWTEGRFGYYKLKLCESSWPIATAAAALTTDTGGVCTEARLAVGGVTAAPMLIDVDDILLGVTVDETVLAAVAARVDDSLEVPWSDALADGEYRRSVAGVIARRALAKTLMPVTP